MKQLDTWILLRYLFVWSEKIIKPTNKKMPRIQNERTVVRHVEGGETGVSVAKHSFNGVFSVDSAPTSTGLPHAVKDPTYVKRIVPVIHRDPPSSRLLRCGRDCG